MSKRSAIAIIAVILCLAFASSAFAGDKVYPGEYRIFTVKDEAEDFYSLEEAYWYSPVIYSVEVLEFVQAYLEPDDPVSFFLSAAECTDEEIDQYAVIFQSFLEPEYIGALPFEFRCDIEALVEYLGYDLFDRNGRYELSYYFEDPAFLAQLFPRGIGRANAYDTFRRCAVHLAFYAAKHGTTPSFQICYDYIQYMLSYYEQLFNDAMASEAATTVTEAN